LLTHSDEVIVFSLSGEGTGTGYSFDGLVYWMCGAVASGSALLPMDFRWTLCSVSSKVVLVQD